MSWATAVVRSVASAGLGLGLQGTGVLKVDVSQLPLVEGELWGIDDSKGSWKVTFFTVFLLPQARVIIIIYLYSMQ